MLCWRGESDPESAIKANLQKIEAETGLYPQTGGLRGLL